MLVCKDQPNVVFHARCRADIGLETSLIELGKIRVGLKFVKENLLYSDKSSEMFDFRRRRPQCLQKFHFGSIRFL